MGYNFGHKVELLAVIAPHALFPKLATKSCHMHCYISLDCPIGIIS